MVKLYNRKIDVIEELRMKYSATEKLMAEGFAIEKKRGAISIYVGKYLIAKLIHSKEEGVPVALINKSSKIRVGRGLKFQLEKIFLETGWAIGSANL